MNETAVARAREQVLQDCDLRDAALDMLSQLMRDPAFDELRTKEQLGYIVFAMQRKADTLVRHEPPLTRNVTALVLPPAVGRAGYDDASFTTAPVPRRVVGDTMQSIVVLVQGAAQPADIMDARIAAFVASFEAFLVGMDMETWMSAINGVRSNTRRTPQSMAEAFGWEWDEVGKRSFRTSRRVEEALALRRVRLEHVVALYRELTTDASSTRIASVEVFGKGATIAMPTGGAAPTSIVPSEALV